MTDSNADSAPRLWSVEGFRDDIWTSADTVDHERPVILPLETFLQLDDETRLARSNEIGVELQPGDKLDDILPYLDHLPVIALAFPTFSDGRGYSRAQLLRSRHNYGGTIRATGDVLIDQIPLMVRMGIDEFIVTNQTALDRLSDGQIGGLPLHYQPAAKATPKAGTYAWRHLSA